MRNAFHLTGRSKEKETKKGKLSFVFFESQVLILCDVAPILQRPLMKSL
jgi:hypothetical protein